MQKLLLISILVITFVIPAVAARDPSPRRALRRTIFWMMAGLFSYVLAVILLYARLG
jgi:hypothetical protein